MDGLPLFGMAAATAVVTGTALLLPLAFTAVRRLRAAWRCFPTLSLAAAFLAAYPGRAAVASASLVAAVALVGSMDLMVTSFRRTVMEWVDQTLTGDLFLRPAGRAGAWTGDVAGALAAAVRATRGVLDVDRVTVQALDLDATTVRLQLHDMDVLARRGRLRMVDGSDSRPLCARAAPGSTGVTYWEGLVRVRGTRDGRPVTGLGYLELTGYAGPTPLAPGGPGGVGKQP